MLGDPFYYAIFACRITSFEYDKNSEIIPDQVPL